MDDDVLRLRYRWGLTDRETPLDALPQIDLRGRDIPSNVLLTIAKERIAELGGTRGDPAVGIPVEVDDLVIGTAGGQTKIRVYNRGIHLIKTDDDELVRIHRVCCLLQRLLPQRPGVQAQGMRA